VMFVINIVFFLIVYIIAFRNLMYMLGSFVHILKMNMLFYILYLYCHLA